MHIAIIGAGVMGCACAHRLLQSGHRVTLLERALPGAESSAAAAGILGGQSEVAGAGPYLELCLASRAMFGEYVRELEELSQIAIGYETSGVLEVATDPAAGHLVASRAEWMLERGLRVEILDRAAARALEPALSPRILGANYYPDDHQLDPERLSRALATAVARLGGEFRSGVGVRSLIIAGERVTGVATLNETLSADAVVIAAGAWSTMVPGLPPLRTQIKPMAGQIVQLESRPRFFRHVVYGMKGYIVPRADGRVLLGSTLEDRGFDKAVTAGGINQITTMGIELVPQLAQTRFTGCWSGLRPAPLDNLPLLGAGPYSGVYFATGHYRNGILLTPITGQIIADLINGTPPCVEIAPFSPLPPGAQ